MKHLALCTEAITPGLSASCLPATSAFQTARPLTRRSRLDRRPPEVPPPPKKPPPPPPSGVTTWGGQSVARPAAEGEKR